MFTFVDIFNCNSSENKRYNTQNRGKFGAVSPKNRINFLVGWKKEIRWNENRKKSYIYFTDDFSHLVVKLKSKREKERE